MANKIVIQNNSANVSTTIESSNVNITSQEVVINPSIIDTKITSSSPDILNVSPNIEPVKVISQLIPGPKGDKGDAGDQGLSAYEVAVQNGFSGTEEEWLDSLNGGSAVLSVNGETGIVVLDKNDIGLSDVDNTSDVDKPISTAVQTALDDKQNQSSILDNTTASFTTDLETKINNIQDYLFIQDTQPTTSLSKYLWIDTSNGNISFWIEDGS